MKEVTLIIPAYNEAARIMHAASRMVSSKYLGNTCTLLFIVDGTDETYRILEKLKNENPGADIVLRKYAERLGKGGAVGEGIKDAKTPYAGFLDVDEHIPLETVEKAVRMLLEGKLDCVVCSRQGAGERPFMRKLASRAFNSLVNLLFGFGIPDTQCGCKLFKSRLVQSEESPVFRIRGFAFDVELLDRIKKNGGEITEYKIQPVKESGGNFSLLESPGMLWDLLRLRFF
ncbi:MAG: glycosyltransferase [bacterium]|nr:glycosyltransferase [bacterium]